MREPIAILFFVEHADRELDLVCLLKHLLESRHGLRTEIASIEFGRNEATECWAPEVVALPYTFTGLASHSLPQIIASFPCATFVDMSYEQLYHGLNQDWRGPKDAFSRDQVIHLAWGQFHTRFLRAHGVPARHVLETGNPIYDLYREKYRRYFPSRQELAQEYGLDVTKRWVFIPENYKAAFLPDSGLMNFVNRGAELDEVLRYREYDKASFSEAINWVVSAAQSGTCEIILRPRPATTQEHFVAACKAVCPDLPSALHITKTRTVREWVLASDMVMSSISTTLIEAAVARRTIFSLQPRPMPDFLRMDWLGMVQCLKTEITFLKAIAGEGESSNWSGLRQWIGRTMPSDGAIDRVVAALLRVVRRELALPAPLSIEDIRSRVKAPIRVRVINFVRRKYACSLKRLRNAGRTIAPVYSEFGGLDASKSETKWGKVDLFQKDQFTPPDIDRRLKKWAELCTVSSGTCIIDGATIRKD